MSEGEAQEIRVMLESMSDDIAALKSNGTTLRLTTGGLAFAWAIVLGLLSSVFFIAQLASAQASLATSVAVLQADLHHHEELPGHPVVVERVNHLTNEIEGLRDKK